MYIYIYRYICSCRGPCRVIAIKAGIREKIGNVKRCSELINARPGRRGNRSSTQGGGCAGTDHQRKAWEAEGRSSTQGLGGERAIITGAIITATPGYLCAQRYAWGRGGGFLPPPPLARGGGGGGVSTPPPFSRGGGGGGGLKIPPPLKGGGGGGLPPPSQSSDFKDNSSSDLIKPLRAL